MGRRIGIELRPAHPSMVGDEHKPTLPDWFPLPGSKVLRSDPDDPDTADESPENRIRVREQARTTAACEGPHDGEKRVAFTADDEPPKVLWLDDGRTAYLRSDAESARVLVVYRYSPATSPGHDLYMRAVEDAYAEYGRTYAQEARHDDPQHFGVHLDRRD